MARKDDIYSAALMLRELSENDHPFAIFSRDDLGIYTDVLHCDIDLMVTLISLSIIRVQTDWKECGGACCKRHQQLFEDLADVLADNLRELEEIKPQ